MNTHHLLGISGGKDSAALAIYMRRKYPELDIKYFFTDTGKELPEVYEFLMKLEGVLNRKIYRLGIKSIDGRERDFDWWLKQYGYFLPSPQTRWCTRKLKLDPFKNWIKPWLSEGDAIVQYVAIRADETHREGLWNTDPKMRTALPFRENGVDKQGVLDILESEGIGLPSYYDWRSRSGCTFCFFQQKIEWVNLKERHPEKFEEAKSYEKIAMTNQSPFTWSQGESLEELEKPERIEQIKKDFEKRLSMEEKRRRRNPLREGSTDLLDIDDLYLEDEGNGACLVCHK